MFKTEFFRKHEPENLEKESKEIFQKLEGLTPWEGTSESIFNNLKANIYFPNARNEKNNTVLQYCIINSEYGFLKLMLAEESIKFNYMHINQNGKTALQLACDDPKFPGDLLRVIYDRTPSVEAEDYKKTQKSLRNYHKNKLLGSAATIAFSILAASCAIGYYLASAAILATGPAVWATLGIFIGASIIFDIGAFLVFRAVTNLPAKPVDIKTQDMGPDVGSTKGHEISANPELSKTVSQDDLYAVQSPESINLATGKSILELDNSGTKKK